MGKGPKLICLSEAFCWFVIPHIALRQKDAAFNAIFGMNWIKSSVTLLIKEWKVLAVLGNFVEALRLTYS